MSHLDIFDLRQLITSETDSAIAKWGRGIEIALRVDTRHRSFITMVISRNKTVLEQLKLDLPWADLEPTLSSKDPTPSPRKIIRAPGTKLLRASEFLFSKKTFTMVLQPTLADMQEEYFEALSKGRFW